MRFHYILLEPLKFKTLTTVNDGEDVVQLELSFTVGGNAKWKSHRKKSWTISYKIKYTLIPSSNLALWYLKPKSVENYAHTNLYIECLYQPYS